MYNVRTFLINLILRTAKFRVQSGINDWNIQHPPPKSQYLTNIFK